MSTVRFSPLTAALTLCYTIGASVLWYLARRHHWGVLGRSETVIALVLGGVIVFFGALWATRGLAPWRLSRETKVVVGTMVVFLGVFWLYGRRGSYAFWFGENPPLGGLRGLLPYFFFVAASVLCRVLLPLLTGRLVLGRTPRDYGYTLVGAFKKWWLYLLLVALVLPFVVYASSLPAFLRKYPWCRQALVDGTLDAQVFALYATAAFIFYASGEAFWRGYLLLGTARELGKNALFLMVMPYVLGHLGKPLPETLGAVLAGLVLGTLALHHRSFWLGAVCHWLIAMSMDLLALWRKGVIWLF
ncbi:MAG: CPBP family intramembrane metalloprotease [Myxococcales bacterium]|nr:CPBP family intramembrane metalloprotease [Myxococcales bacterium]